MNTPPCLDYDTLPDSGPRSRIDGTLRRAISTDIVLRRDDPQRHADSVMRLDMAVSSEVPYLRDEGWDEPWVEILGHKPGEIDLARLTNGAPVLANHDRWITAGNTPLSAIGKVESARIDDDRKVRVSVALSPRDALADLRRDIELGFAPKVSIGYRIDERVLVRAGDKTSPPVYRVTKWQPFEVSLVDIAADDTVGLGRGAPSQVTSRTCALDTPRVVEIDEADQTPPPQPAAAGQHPPHHSSTRILVMTDISPAAPLQPQPNVDALVQAERARVAEISALADQYRAYLKSHDGADAVRNGCSVDEFRQYILAQITLRHTDKSLDIGMTKREQSRYSFIRLLGAMSSGDWSLAGLERECSQEVARQFGRPADGAYVPYDMLFARDFNVGTSTEAGNLVQTDVRSDMMADFLRNKLVLGQLGVTMLTGLTNTLSIPRQSVGATIGTLTEIGSASETNPNIQTLTLQPKRAGAYVEVSKQALIQANPSVEALIRNDLVQQTLVLIENQAINGTATSPQHNGIRFTVGVGTTTAGANGAVPAWSHFVDLESACANANAEPDMVSGYLINTRTRGKAKQTQFATNLPMIWQPGDQPLNGYRVGVTNNVPSNLTKGTSTTVCSAAIFGANWSDCIIGFFGGADVTVDPYTKADYGQVKITMNQFADSGVRQPASFAKIEDLVTS